MPLITATLDGKHSATAESFIQSAIEDERVRALVRAADDFFGDPEPATYEEVLRAARIRLQRFDRLELRGAAELQPGPDGRERIRVRLETVR